MGDYQLPVGDVWVSASWESHKDRTPPSSEPGTDYACAYGTTVVAPQNATVTYVKTSNSGAMGRVVEFRGDDGRDGRSLHMSEVWVSEGQRISRGQSLGLSGASGNNSDWYYGPHCHQTLWPGAAWAADTIDFEPYVGNEDDDMTPEQAAMLEDVYNAVVWLKSRVGGSVEKDDPTLTYLGIHGTDWLEQRIGGSTDSKDISYEIDDIHKAVVPGEDDQR